jgi:hypothetical protein
MTRDGSEKIPDRQAGSAAASDMTLDYPAIQHMIEM